MANSNRPRRGALLVALGITASRLAGLARETVTSRLLGNTAAADAFAVAMRIPNLLQNLLGEGVLSASFVPVYSRMISPSGKADNAANTGTSKNYGPTKDAALVAGAMAALLMTVTGLGVLVLVTLARPITFVLAPGLSASRFELAVSLTRITSVGVGFAVMSAWCLGVLNSHRRYFLAYAAPVLWNAVQIGALVTAWILAFDLDGTTRALAWGVTGGGLAQVLVQLPLTMHLARGLRLNWGRGLIQVRQIIRRFVPAVLGRGVVQISAYVDLALASLLATGAVAALFRAQILYTLPISLFAMSVAAAELPEMSRIGRNRAALAGRAHAAARKVAFWMLLTAVVYVAAGDLVVGLLFEGGQFSSGDTVLVWFVIAVYSLGLPATGISRVLQNISYALGDTAGPARIATVRVTLAAAVGAIAMFPLDRVIVGPDGLLNLAEALRPAWALPAAERELADVVRLGAVGLAVGSALAAWTEIALLAELLRRRLGNVGIGQALSAPVQAAAGSFAAAAALKLVVGDWPVVIAAPMVLGATVFLYAVVAFRCGVDESRLLLGPARRIIWYNTSYYNENYD